MTDVFAQSIGTSPHLMSARADAQVKTLGAEDYSERMKLRQATLAGLERRLLKREIFVAMATTDGTFRVVPPAAARLIRMDT